MKQDDKDRCKSIIRDAMDGYNNYNHYNVASYSEKMLLWRGIESVFDNMPIDYHRASHMRDYCERIMSRLLGL